MRAPFEYETNRAIIREVLVPDPLSREAFEVICEKWDSGAQDTLPEIICKGGWLSLEILETAFIEASGCGGVVRTGPVESPEGTEARILKANGFIVVHQGKGENLVAGGKELNPDLKAFIGKAAEKWRWVLMSPVRDAPCGTVAQSPSPSLADTAETPRRLRHLLQEARLFGARDLHFERTGGSLLIRIQGPSGMRELGTLSGPRMEKLLRLLKRWCGFSVADNLLPQDGRLRLVDHGEQQVFRASLLHTINGESLVLRPLGSPGDVREITNLGMPPELLSQIRDTVRHEKGILLLCGATGSGKTTTAYALLKEMAGSRVKILTIEDPVEYELPDITQSSVRADSGWDFPTALRAYLRQDPDVILVGEIRDTESARLAFRAAITGHLVITTVHSSSVEQVYSRLAGWGIEPGTAAESVRMIVHQRMRYGVDGPAPEVTFTWERPAEVDVYGKLAARSSGTARLVGQSLCFQ